MARGSERILDLPLLAAQRSADALGHTVGVGKHGLGVHPHELPPFLEDASIHKDPLDVARLGVEDHLAHVVKAWRKVEGLRIEHNNIGLLARRERADLVRHIENLSATQSGQVQGVRHRGVDGGVARHRAL